MRSKLMLFFRHFILFSHSVYGVKSKNCWVRFFCSRQKPCVWMSWQGWISNFYLWGRGFSFLSVHTENAWMNVYSANLFSVENQIQQYLDLAITDSIRKVERRVARSPQHHLRTLLVEERSWSSVSIGWWNRQVGWVVMGLPDGLTGSCCRYYRWNSYYCIICSVFALFQGLGCWKVCHIST